MLTATGLVRPNIADFSTSANGYLSTDKKIREGLRQKIAEHSNGKTIVGISWLSKNEKAGRKRTIPPVELVSALPENWFLVNLQYGDVSQDLSEIRTKLNRSVATFNDIDNWKDLELFAYLIAACDKVVSVDNSTVHFAGALGKECHVLLPYSSDWRWVSEENRSYWYNSRSSIINQSLMIGLVRFSRWFYLSMKTAPGKLGLLCIFLEVGIA